MPMLQTIPAPHLAHRAAPRACAVPSVEPIDADTLRFELIDLDRNGDPTFRAVAAALRRAPRDINRHGQRVTGIERDGCEKAVLLDRDWIVELGVLTAGDESSRALAVNDTCQVVGLSRRGAYEHAFIWQHGCMLPLGGLQRGIDRRREAAQALQSSRARAINGRGQVVGRATCEDRVCGFLWSFWDGMLDLGDLLTSKPGMARWRVVDARHIDDLGRILATAVCEGRYREVLLCPVR